MLLVLGTLNVIWGIAAIGDSTFFTEDAKYVLGGLNTWGWVTLLIASRSSSLGCRRSPVAASAAGSGSSRHQRPAIVSLLSVPAYPFWSLCVFALAIIVVYELAKPPPAV